MKYSRWLFAIIPLLALTLVPRPAIATGRAPAPVSQIVVDAQTGRPFLSLNADRLRPPASLAKMMTVLLVFDALRAGKIRPTDQIVMTTQSVRQAPTRLGLIRGRSLDLISAVRAVAVISANDVAVALAERLAGSEPKFVAMMNRRAAQIGMANTRFGNATGLAPGAGLSTASDMAVLSRYLVTHYPDRYKAFGRRSIQWKGWVRPNHNRLLGKVRGLDGIKTGYTVQAGFNLAASARQGKRRVIVVVMGARTAAARDTLVTKLLGCELTSPAVVQSVRKGRSRQVSAEAPRAGSLGHR
jgi:D-alanyl-D-alanine carboxypeptidase